MATAKQCCQFIADALWIPDSVVSDCAEALRSAEYLPATQGTPTPLESKHVALILLSALLGNHRADGHAERVASYASMRPLDGGSTFGETLAAYIDNPHNLFEIRLDAHVPGATITYRQDNGGMAVTSFTTDDPQPRPAFGREVIIGPEPLTRLAAAIESAPPVRAGRPRERDRYRRVERAVIFN